MIPSTSSIDAVRRATLSMGAIALLAGCAPYAQAGDDSPATGEVVDARTGEPIAGAWIFEAVPGERGGSDVRRFERVREARTDAAGRFEFPPAASGWLASLFASPRAPRYHVYHPTYGLVWGREHAGRIVLNLRDAHLRLDDATRLCRSDATDPLHSRVRLLHCPPARPDVLENGHARATGPLDDRGRRTGAWRFFRDDGSLLAEGAYQAGAATGEWVFHPIDRNDGN